MSPAVDLGGRPVLVLAFDPAVPPPRLVNAGSVVWVGATSVGAPSDHVQWSSLRALAPDDRLRRLAAIDVVVSTLRGATPADVLAAIRYGGRRFHVFHSPGALFETNGRGMLLLATRRALARRLRHSRRLGDAIESAFDCRLDPPWPTLRDTRSAVVEVLRQRPGGSAPAPRAAPRRLVHYLGGLGPGGAERQLTYVANGSRAAGHDVSVLSASPLVGAGAHYVHALAGAGVAATAVAPTWRTGEAVRALPPTLRRSLERHIVWSMISPLVEELRRLRPDVLHAWMDLGNTVGALAALLAGVPRIVLSLRSVNPSHFPALHQPWFKATYRALARAPEITFVANSHHGARDYARWIGIRSSRIEVVHNGVPLPARAPTPDERRVERRALGIPEDVFLVVGVLRLSSEKRPLDFVEALARAGTRVAALRGVHVGVGPMAEQAHRVARERLGDRLRFVGRDERPERWLRVADACLLTSEQEGCPNVLLEAQALGVPVVLTRAGGAPETVVEAETGLIADVGDADALAEHLLTLHSDPARARAMGDAGRRHVGGRFSVDAMVRQTMALYDAR